MQTAESQPETTAEIVSVDTVDQLWKAVLQWHTPKVGELLQLSQIPDNPDLEINVDGVSHKMTGDFRKGFIAAIETAFVMFGTLPFQAHSDDSQPTPESGGDGPKPT